MHAPNGEECGLGCMLCNDEATRDSAEKKEKLQKTKLASQLRAILLARSVLLL